MRKKREQIEALLKQDPHTASVYAERVMGRLLRQSQSQARCHHSQALLTSPIMFGEQAHSHYHYLREHKNS